jgi:hypothetical protein
MSKSMQIRDRVRGKAPSVKGSRANAPQCPCGTIVDIFEDVVVIELDNGSADYCPIAKFDLRWNLLCHGHPIPDPLFDDTATTKPLPTATTKPLPTATTKPLPTATTKPLPTATTKPLPTATTDPPLRCLDRDA